ncbi:hypothetical protein H0H93_001033 [Arthromyces matolae]|nr:hypothetical protein H0H93_001033 [Arthromyces matolae]
MFLHFDPNKVVLPPVLGGLAPQNHPSTPLPGSSHYAAVYDPIAYSNFQGAAERAPQSQIKYATQQRLKTYQNRDELMTALGNCFRESQSVDFAACYSMHEPSISHKQRIQSITHEIWKTTGYRFTVKDHPRAKGGHKTRLWCSQDISHKTKPSKASPAPRVTSDGTVMAKARYPCRSGLLISSRDDDEPGVAHVVVRMHHHLAHEPYYDHTLPPEMTQSIWQRIQKPMHDAPTVPSPGPSHAGPTSHASPDEGESLNDLNHSDHEDSIDLLKDSSPTTGDHPTTGDNSSSLTPEVFQQRMLKHISDIRDFCCGLEYQLQFNDYKLLEVLESEGSQFLRLVHQCLEFEGRSRPKSKDEGQPSNEI